MITDDDSGGKPLMHYRERRIEMGQPRDGAICICTIRWEYSESATRIYFHGISTRTEYIHKDNTLLTEC